MKDELIYFAKRIYDKGLSPAASGNISIKDKDGSVLISASGACLGDLTQEDIVKVNIAGGIIEGCKKPSSELLMHLKIYKKRPDLNAIIHSHSPEISAFAVAGLPLDKPILPEFALYFNTVPIAKYYTPSSKELAIEVSRYFENKNTVLMANHGIITANKSMKQAFYSLEMLQAYCITYLNAIHLGKIRTLNDSQIMQINKLKQS